MGFDGLEVNSSVGAGGEAVELLEALRWSGLSPVRLSAGHGGRLHRISRGTVHIFDRGAYMTFASGINSSLFPRCIKIRFLAMQNG